MGHGEQCVDRHIELSGFDRKSLRKVTTPTIDDHLLAPEDHVTRGRLVDMCSKIVLKVFYLARIKKD